MDKLKVVWVASYPKSGNTWISSVLRAAGAKHGFPQATMDVYEMTRRKELPLTCPAVSPALGAGPHAVLKTHSPFSVSGQPHEFPGLGIETAGFVHIYRNPLDVLLSYIGFTRIEYQANPRNEAYRRALFVDLLGFAEPLDYETWLSMSLDDIPQRNLDHALDAFSENGLGISTLNPMSGTWIENTRSWLQAGKLLPSHSIRYEDCLEDSAHILGLSDMFTFGQEEMSKALAVVNKNARDASASDDRYRSIFFSKLSSYYFSSYFSNGAIRRFCARNEGTLREFGYQAILNSAQ